MVSAPLCINMRESGGKSFQRQTVEAMGAGASGEAPLEPVEADELEG